MPGDVKKTIFLDVDVDIAKLKKAISEANGLSKEQMKERTAAIRGLENIERIQTKSRNKQKSSGKKATKSNKAALRHHKDVEKSLKRQIKLHRDLERAVRRQTKSVARLNRELRKSGKLAGGGRGGRQPPAQGAGKAAAGAAAGGLLAGPVGAALAALAGAISFITGNILGLVTGQIRGGYSAKRRYGAAIGRLTGLGGTSDAINRLRPTAVQYGFDPTEMASQALPVARATGAFGGEALTTAMAFQRATGMDIGETSGAMGALTRAGYGFSGKDARGKKELSRMIEMGMESGLKRGRLPEYFQAVTNVVQAQARFRAGDVDATGIQRMLSRMGATGLSGLQGARGGQVMQALEQGFRAQGGSEAGRALMLRSMGYGMPGGTRSLYEAERMLERGATEENVQRLFERTELEQGGGQRQIWALQNMLPGLTKEQLEGLREAFRKGDSGRVKKILQDAKPVEKQALEQMQSTGETIRDMAKLASRDIKIGMVVEKHLHRIRDLINKFVTDQLPNIEASLKIMADTLQAIDKFIRGVFGKQARTEEEQKAEVKAAKEAAPTEQIRIAREAQKRAKELEDPSMLTKITAGATDVARMWSRLPAAAYGGPVSELPSRLAGLPEDLRKTARTGVVAERMAAAGQEQQVAQAASVGVAQQTIRELTMQRVKLAEGGLTETEKVQYDALVRQQENLTALIAELIGGSVERRELIGRLAEGINTAASVVDVAERFVGGTGSPAGDPGTVRPTTTGVGRQ